VLGDYNFLNRLSKIIEDIGYKENKHPKENVVLNSVNEFWNMNTPLKKKVKHIISRKLRLNN
jgi:hypothetical protein